MNQLTLCSAASRGFGKERGAWGKEYYAKYPCCSASGELDNWKIVRFKDYENCSPVPRFSHSPFLKFACCKQLKPCSRRVTLSAHKLNTDRPSLLGEGF